MENPATFYRYFQVEDFCDVNKYGISVRPNDNPSEYIEHLSAIYTKPYMNKLVEALHQLNNNNLSIEIHPIFYDFRRLATDQKYFEEKIIKTLINCRPDPHGKRTTILITHSYGGLILAEFLREFPQMQQLIDSVINVAVPWSGAEVAHAITDTILTPFRTPEVMLKKLVLLPVRLFNMSLIYYLLPENLQGAPLFTLQSHLKLINVCGSGVDTIENVKSGIRTIYGDGTVTMQSCRTKLINVYGVERVLSVQMNNSTHSNILRNKNLLNLIKKYTNHS